MIPAPVCKPLKFLYLRLHSGFFFSRFPLADFVKLEQAGKVWFVARFVVIRKALEAAATAPE
jgi:hypothetical protein